jgi:peptidoglycan hydrolase-like protein with peptidoglycan-binding domain
MKLLLTICLLLICAPSIAIAQTRSQIREAEHRLSVMGYWTGPIDGRFDPATRQALIAFQKYEGRPITAKLSLDELEEIRTSNCPKARELGYAHVEVDIDRQVLLLVNDEGAVRVLPTSTGTGKPFIDQGQQSVAYTPRGRFVVYEKSVGWEKGSLGSVYYQMPSAGAWRFTGPAAYRSKQRVMVAFAYQCSPLVK